MKSTKLRNDETRTEWRDRGQRGREDNFDDMQREKSKANGMCDDK